MYDTANKLLQLWAEMVQEMDRIIAEMPPDDPSLEALRLMRQGMVRIIESLDEP